MPEPIYRQVLEALEDREPHRVIELAHELRLEPRQVFDAALRLHRYGQPVDLSYRLDENGRRRQVVQLGRQQSLFGKETA